MAKATRRGAEFRERVREEGASPLAESEGKQKSAQEKGNLSPAEKESKRKESITSPAEKAKASGTPFT